MNPRILAALLVLTACSGPPASDTGAPIAAETAAVGEVPNPGLAPGEHVWTTADGVELPYTVASEGDATVVLVHCWMCDRSFWSEQVPILAETYRTINLDLPGHGAAGTGRTQWTVGGFGEDVAGLLRSLDLENVILVGHSMGGPVSLRAAALSEGRVRGIVAVDTLHDAEFDFSGEEVEKFLRAFENDFVGTCRSFVDQMFVEEGVEEIQAHVAEVGCRPDRSEIGTALMRDFGAIDMKRWFREAGVPIRAVNAAAPNPTQVETNRKYADFDATLIEGVGHYLQMTRPEEVNPRLMEAIAELLSATGRENDAPGNG